MVDDPAAAAAVAAEVIARSLGNAVRRRGVAFVAFSGGSTPALMLAGLAALDVPWSGVHAFQVDERVVPDGAERGLVVIPDIMGLRPLFDDHVARLAAETGADLIVMGGYGHSRLREFVMGGVTRTMLATMTVPVLMSH